MRRPRHLSPEERSLWNRVADRATPMHPEQSGQVPQLPVAHQKKPSRQSLPEFRIGQSVNGRPAHDLLPSLTDRLSRAPVNMDHKSFGKMKRGKLVPEARIDLHGMTLAQAHPELVGFILRSQTRGLRLVLVITGKGKDRDDGGPIPTSNGVLRHQVPQWLALPPLNNAILQITPAHLKHGGHGAYYVYLRRNR